MFKINDTYEKVTCRICGKNLQSIAGSHLMRSHNSMEKEDYIELYPEAPLFSQKMIEYMKKENGKHMKTDKYKKLFSDKAMGEKNPNHHSKTTEEERKSRSPFSKEFVKYKDLDNKEEVVKKFAKEALKDRIATTDVNYYINQGHDLETAKQLLSERQRTFTLEKCIEKYGEVDGLIRWEERQEKWHKGLKENGNLKCGYSKISQDVFNEIVRLNGDNENIYYATKNSEYYLNQNKKGFYAYDFTDTNKKKIIEFNGDLYHANPSIYKADEYSHPFYIERKLKSSDIWDKDKRKLNAAKESGFDVLIIWESEYKKDKNNTIQKCLDFLNG